MFGTQKASYFLLDSNMFNVRHVENEDDCYL